MSDPYGSYGNPYGAPPPYPNQPSVWPPPTGQPIGQPMGPGFPPGAPLPPPGPYLPPVGLAPPERRPGVVTAGAVIAIVLSGLALLGGLLGVVGVIADHVDPDPGDYMSAQDMAIGLVFCAVVIAACAFAIVLAALAMGRRQWARITLVVLGFVSFAALLPMITSVLLLLPSAGRWYAGRGHRRPPPLPPEIGPRQP